MTRATKRNLAALRCPDHYHLESRLGDGSYRRLDELSGGQRVSMLLSLLLKTEDNRPLVIDQPEDELDNRFLFETVLPALKQLKGRRQIIVATHNANIVVNGDADMVIQLEATAKSGRAALPAQSRNLRYGTRSFGLWMVAKRRSACGAANTVSSGLTMDWLDVLRRIEGGEDARTEFKRGPGDLSLVGKAMCAFGNARGGGLIILGVDDAGTIVGVKENSEKTQDRLTSFLQTGCSASPLSAECAKHLDGNNWVHWIEVGRQRRRFEPLHFRGILLGPPRTQQRAAVAGPRPSPCSTTSASF